MMNTTKLSSQTMSFKKNLINTVLKNKILIEWQVLSTNKPNKTESIVKKSDISKLIKINSEKI